MKVLKKDILTELKRFMFPIKIVVTEKSNLRNPKVDGQRNNEMWVNCN